jgi:hypothetical protein
MQFPVVQKNSGFGYLSTRKEAASHIKLTAIHLTYISQNDNHHCFLLYFNFNPNSLLAEQFLS